MADLRGAVALITGASSGIGEATARAFGRAGARLALAARRADRLEALAGDLRASGLEAAAFPADLCRLDDIQRLVEGTLARFGRIDVLFNNAGFGRLDWLEKLDPREDIEAQFAVNVLWLVHTSRLVLPVMMRQRAGHIINMASVAALIAAPTYSIYSSTKFAVRGFTEALRREAAPWGVRVSLVCPGGIATEFAARAGIHRRTGVATPRWLRLTPDDVAQAVVGLVRRPRAVLVLPWVYRLAVWANWIAPGLVDWATVKWFTIPEREDDLRERA